MTPPVLARPEAPSRITVGRLQTDVNPPTDENRFATPNLMGPGRFAAPAVAVGGGRGEPPGVAPRPERGAAMCAYANAAYSPEETRFARAPGRHVGTLAPRNRVPSAPFGGGDTDEDGATMGDDGVRGTDANMSRGKRANGPAAPPKRILSNREIADGLFAVFGDFYALEREAFGREVDAEPPCAECSGRGISQ